MKLRYMVMIIVILLAISAMCLGYCKGKQEEIDHRRTEAIASRNHLPIYYKGD